MQLKALYIVLNGYPLYPLRIRIMGHSFDVHCSPTDCNVSCIINNHVARNQKHMVVHTGAFQIKYLNKRVISLCCLLLLVLIEKE